MKRNPAYINEKNKNRIPPIEIAVSGAVENPIMLCIANFMREENGYLLSDLRDIC